MMKPMSVKILRYHALLISGFVMGLIFLFISAMFGAKGLLFILIGLVFIICFMIVRYFCMGLFIAQELENNRITIKWIRKPLFSDESDFEIDLMDIREVSQFNDFLSHTPDEFYLKTYSGKSMSFHVPIYSLGRDYRRFYGILQSGKYLSDKKHNTEQGNKNYIKGDLKENE